MKETKTKSFEEMKKTINTLMETNYESFVKALISIETDISDEVVLNKMYEEYMDADNVGLINGDMIVFR